MLSDDGTYYRYSVKCGRAENALIEKLAKAASVTVTTYVQRHFETLWRPLVVNPLSNTALMPMPLHRPPMPPQNEPFLGGENRYLKSKALTEHVLSVMWSMATDDGLVAASYGDLGTWLGRVPMTMQRHVLNLIRTGRIMMHTPSKAGSKPIYQLLDTDGCVERQPGEEKVA